MSTLSVATISGVTTLTGGGFDQIGASANSANAAAIASLTTANLALLTANIANTTANATTLAMSTFVGTQNGQIIMTTNTATPFGGYLLCDGSVYSRSTYPNLANVSNVAVLSATYLANLGYTSSQSPGPVGTGGAPNFYMGISVSNNGIIFNQLGNGPIISTSGSTDNGLTWRLLATTVTSNVSVGIFNQHTVAISSGGGWTYHPTIAYNGTNYVTGNAYIGYIGSGVRYGSNVFALNTYTATNINFAVNGIVWTGARFIAAGTGVAGNTASYSADGITWTVGGGIANSSSALSHGYKRLAYGVNTLVIGTSNTVSQTNVFSFPIIRYSQDNGVSFSTATQPSGFGVNSGFNSSNTIIRYVGYINNQFIAVDHAGAIANSPNGIVWNLAAAANTLNSFYDPLNLETDALTMNPLTDNRTTNWNMDYAQGYYIYGSLYSTNLTTWNRFPQQSAKRNITTPIGWGAVLPTSNVYYFPGSVAYTGDGGSCSTYVYTPGGYWNPYPFTGTQFSVPYLTDEVSGMVKYYIKT
jgi:hypothetical protein